jgi:hypothetical protein
MNRWWIALITAVFAAACHPRGDEAPAVNADKADSEDRTIKVLISVDWEGDTLDDANLKAMIALRDKFPQLRLTHYLNAAYYTKPGADPAAITAKINSVIRPDKDEIGLHIHPWKTLVEASGVTFHSKTHDVTGLDTTKFDSDCSFDCGYYTALNEYTTDEIAKMLAFSVQTLQKQGFATPVSFRAGYFMADQRVFEALSQQKFVRDSSALPAAIIKDEAINRLANNDARGYEEFWTLYNNTLALWPLITSSSQPYTVSTAGGMSSLQEIPLNGSMVDFYTGPFATVDPDTSKVVSVDEVRAVQSMINDAYWKVRDEKLADPTSAGILAFAFHQDYATYSPGAPLPRLETFLDDLLRTRQLAALENMNIVFVTTADVAH